VLDVSARADLLTSPWGVYAAVQSAVVSCLGQQGTDCDVYDDLSVGVGVERRSQVGAATIDLGLDPALTWMHMELDGTDETNSLSRTLVTLRVDGSSRLSVPLGEATSLTVTVDVGLAPILLVSPERAGPGAQPFPVFCGGIRLGFMSGLF
jgi:hypothetical protein